MPLEKPHAVPEPLNDRYNRYLYYFTMHPTQLQRMQQAAYDELGRGLDVHKQFPNKYMPEKCSLMSLDTCVKTVPTGKEQGVFYAVDFGGTNLRSVCVQLDGQGRCKRTQERTNIRTDPVASHLPRGLLDSKATASMLFDTIATSVRRLMEKNNDLKTDSSIPVGFTFSFPMDQKLLNSANLNTWTKGFETGNATKDPVVGMDVCKLLNVAFQRHKVPATVAAALNDTTGTLLSAAYECPSNLPPCRVGVILGTGVNGCYVQPNANEWGYNGVIINTEMGSYDKELPWNVIDIEVDFASNNRGCARYEKMVAGMYLPEICRRLLIKVFQAQAPPDAWVHESIPGEACAAIAGDDPDQLTATKEVLKLMWDWTPSPMHLIMIHKLIAAVFDRSAALAAVAIAAMARKTGQLSPAMGGLTVGVDGSLYTQNPWYREAVNRHLNSILGEDTASLIHFIVSDDGSGKGAAILAAAATCKK